jgi:hypothetical protein
MSRKKFVCLAISRKTGGHCIAGREIGDDGTILNTWIRPISEREKHEVSSSECQYDDKSSPSLGDVIVLTMKNHAPNECHVEDWVLDKGYWWERGGKLTLQQIQALAERPVTLWTNGFKTYAGINNEIPHALSSKLTSSLVFIHVQEMQIEVSAPGADFGNNSRRVQGRFTYNRVVYQLRITDEAIEAEYLSKPDGKYPFGECHLTISLGEPYVKPKDQQKYVYKLIAGVFRNS